MEQTPSSPTGWSVIAELEGAASLVGAALELDARETYTRSELAERAGVPLKELYLSDTLSTLVEIGLLRRIENDGEATYAIEDESDVYERAAAFEAAVTAQVDD